MNIKITNSMCRKIFLPLVLLFTVMNISTAQANTPDGWTKAGTEPESYDTGVTTEVSKSGNASAFLKSKAEADEIKGFVTLMQSVSAAKYLGKKIRLSGYIKSENVNVWAALWMRVDAANNKSALAFDNMGDRPITGSTDWTHYEIVLEVAKEAGNISFGFLLAGKGTLWADGLSIELVSDSVPVTKLPRKPQNLDFEN